MLTIVLTLAGALVWICVGLFMVGFSEGVMQHKSPGSRKVYLAMVWPAVAFALLMAQTVIAVQQLYWIAFLRMGGKIEPDTEAPVEPSAQSSMAKFERISADDSKMSDMQQSHA